MTPRLWCDAASRPYAPSKCTPRKGGCSDVVHREGQARVWACRVREKHAQRNEATSAWACCQCERYHMKKMLTNARALAPVFSPEAEMPLCLYDYVCRYFLRQSVSRVLRWSSSTIRHALISPPALPAARS